MDKKLKVQQSKNGLGVFAQKPIKPGQIILEITGNIVHWQDLLKIGGIILDNTYRFDEHNYLSPDGIGNYFNHSCEPNSGVVKQGNKLFLKAIKKIQAGDEIAFDYSTIVGGDDSWTMKCLCGMSACRKKVTNFYKLPSDIRTKYLELGIVPKYIIRSK